MLGRIINRHCTHLNILKISHSRLSGFTEPYWHKWILFFKQASKKETMEMFQYNKTLYFSLNLHYPHKYLHYTVSEHKIKKRHNKFHHEYKKQKQQRKDDRGKLFSCV